MQPSRTVRFRFLCLHLVISLAPVALAPALQAADIAPWELDTFDAGAGFVNGALAGQKGWVALQKSAVVVGCGGDAAANCTGDKATRPNRGRVLSLNPNPGSGSTVDVEKSVASQSNGFHTLELDVLVTGASEPSVAKLAINTNFSAGWDKKFQVYFGTSIRLNYDASGAAVPLVASTQFDHWYHLRLALNLNTQGLNVWVDDTLVTPTPVTVHTGPVVGVGLSGWEFRPGKVYVDNLAGYRQIGKITAPVRGTTVSGTVPVSAATHSSVVAVDFYVDGALQATLNAPPFDWTWDTASNPFPAPSHGGFGSGPLGFGYWLTQWKDSQVTENGCCLPEVAGWTNLYHVRSRLQYELSFDENPPLEVWLSRMEAGLAEARSLGKQILVNLEIPYTCTRNQKAPDVTWCVDMDTVLARLVEYWDSIVAFELADEPAWAGNATAINAAAATLRNRLRDLGFSAFRPVGLVFAHDEEPTGAFLSSTSLDFVTFEAYLNGPAVTPYEFSPLPWQNRNRLNQLVTTLKTKAGNGGKLLVLAGQSYTRNYGWANIDLVRDLQSPPYLMSWNDPNVRTLALFSYERASGAREYPDLQVPHRLIGAAVLGSAPAVPPGNGPRTLAIRALDSSGNSTWDYLKVYVSN